MDRTPGVRVFDALANEYRRHLLLALLDANPQDDDDLDPLELLTRGGAVDDLEVTEIQLRHSHLPKLEEMGYVDWDRDSGEISKGPDWDEIGPLLELIRNHRDELPDEWVSELTFEE